MKKNWGLFHYVPPTAKRKKGDIVKETRIFFIRKGVVSYDDIN